MLKLYRQNARGELEYRQAWRADTESVLVIHEGTVGHTGTVRTVPIPSAEIEEQLWEELLTESSELGYLERYLHERCDVVLQVRMLTPNLGHEFDNWVFDHLAQLLAEALAWHGVGQVDGHDIGGGEYAVFADCVEGHLATAVILQVLSNYEIPTDIRIGVRGPGEPDYALTYTTCPGDEFFDPFTMPPPQ